MKQTLVNVAENLWKSQQSGRYYAILKVNGRQIKKSLKTDDYQLAKRKLRELEKDYHERTGIVGSEPLPKSFKELVVKFTRIVLPTRPLKPLAKLDYLTRQTALLRYTGFAKLPLNRITMIDCQKWFAKRRLMISAQRMNNEVGLLRDILEFARDNGWMMHDPTSKLERLKLPRPNPDPPTAAEFRRLVSTLRSHRDRDAGDLVALMAYSGLRLSEACGLKWQDVDFDRGMFYIAGKGRDETERDSVPLFPAMRDLLLKIRQSRQLRKIEGIKPDDRIMRVNGCRDALKTACREAKLRRNFTHHDMRRYFTTRCMEQGVPIRTLAGWLRHKDGGALLLRTYAAHQDKYSLEMASKINLAVELDADNVVPMRAAKTNA
jgi:integrase